jgi:(p)ppGpp synthase/HD superfamily hydrolase
MKNRYNKAIELAREHHEGQLRKNTGEPYLTHPFAVAGLVASVTYDEDMIIAALLHDTVEDSDLTLVKIEDHFGRIVRKMVDDLTDVSKPSDGNRTIRKRLDRRHTATSWPDSKTIKLADLIDNLKGIHTFSPGFADMYVKEKVLILRVLTEGDAILYKMVEKLIKEFFGKSSRYEK